MQHEALSLDGDRRELDVLSDVRIGNLKNHMAAHHW